MIYIARDEAIAVASLLKEEMIDHAERTGERSQDQEEASQERAANEGAREGEASGR